MVFKKIILSTIVVFNIFFILTASYIACNYDYSLVHDAFEIITSLMR